MIEMMALILANYAISRTVTREDGPFAIFETVRNIAKNSKPIAPDEPTDDAEWETYDRRFDTYERQYLRWKRSVSGTLAGVLVCPYCFGWYSGLLLVAVYAIATGIYWYSPLMWLATVGGANFLQVIEDK